MNKRRLLRLSDGLTPGQQREFSLARTKLEEAVMRAVKGVSG